MAAQPRPWKTVPLELLALPEIRASVCDSAPGIWRWLRCCRASGKSRASVWVTARLCFDRFRCCLPNRLLKNDRNHLVVGIADCVRLDGRIWLLRDHSTA